MAIRRMSRVIIASSSRHMEAVIHVLHRRKVLHIVDYTAEEEEVKLGAPLKVAAHASERQIKLRALAKMLNIGEDVQPGTPEAGAKIEKELDTLIFTLEQNIAGKGEAAQKADAALRDADRRITELEPLAGLGLPLDLMHGSGTVAAFVGSCREEFEGELRKRVPEHELFRRGEGLPGGNTFALFVRKSDSDAALQVLSEHGFAEVKVPDGDGDPAALLAGARESRETLLGKKTLLSGELDSLRKRFAERIMAADEELTVKIHRAEVPLRFATTPNSFMVEGWVPVEDVEPLRKSLEDATGGALLFESSAPEHGQEEEIPVAMKNPRPLKRFEFLLHLYSTPVYSEADPTAFLALLFPVFFGFMIGDLGFGILMLTFGIIFMTRFKRLGMSDIGYYLIFAGFFAAVFGLFLFGDMFGLPFAAEEVGGYSWAGLLNLPLQYEAPLHKLSMGGVMEMLTIAIYIGLFHLTAGLLLGIRNEWAHSRKHAAAKVGWLMVLWAFGLVIARMARETITGGIFWDSLFHTIGTGVQIVGVTFPYASLALLGAGIPVLGATEGVIGVMEIPSLLSNLISYARLAAVGVAKGAMAFGFNTIFLPTVLSADMAMKVLGVVLLVLCQFLFVFALGTLSAAMQAIRLNYVEFFLKFYKGGGVMFEPFGFIRRFTTEKEA